MTFIQSDIFVNLSYILASILFIFGLKMLGSPATARRGNLFSATGMLIAIVAALTDQNIVGFEVIIGGIILGSIIGASAARWVAMTSMPEMVALFNGSGGASSLLVGWATLHLGAEGISTFTASTVALAILIGGVTLTGSLIAYGKLSERINSAPWTFAGQQVFNFLLLAAIVASGVLFAMDPAADSRYLYALIALALVLGVMAVIPVGGADMPVVISLLNSYSGLAACAAGFAVQNNVLIVAGSLVGASGIILTNIMCKAMNRSLVNVLFSGFGAVKQGKAIEGEVKPLSVEDAYYILEAASNVCFVPGYGMAVAQAQHALREMVDALKKNGVKVSYAIHPVAGRMPGHMNVLLAEANVPYDEVFELEEINNDFANADVAFVIGANDVTNPVAKTDPQSPIYGMPVLDVEKCKSVSVSYTHLTLPTKA